MGYLRKLVSSFVLVSYLKLILVNTFAMEADFEKATMSCTLKVRPTVDALGNLRVLGLRFTQKEKLADGSVKRRSLLEEGINFEESKITPHIIPLINPKTLCQSFQWHIPQIGAVQIDGDGNILLNHMRLTPSTFLKVKTPTFMVIQNCKIPLLSLTSSCLTLVGGNRFGTLKAIQDPDKGIISYGMEADRIKNLQLIRGHFHNRGRLSLGEGGLWDLGGNTFTNKGEVSIRGQGVTVRNGARFTNANHLEGTSLKVETTEYENTLSGNISLENHAVKTEKNLINQGNIYTQKKGSYSFGERLVNEGEIKSEEAYDFTSSHPEAVLVNEGTLEAGEGRFDFARLKNNGTISQESSTLALKEVMNTQEIQWGVLEPEAHIQVLGNQGTLYGQGELQVQRGQNKNLLYLEEGNLRVEEKFISSGIFKTHILSGPGSFINDGLLSSCEEKRTLLEIATFENRGTEEKPAVIKTQDLLIHEGVQQFTNRPYGLITTHQLFLPFQEKACEKSIQNWGIIQTNATSLKRNLHNYHRFEAGDLTLDQGGVLTNGEGATLKIKDLSLPQGEIHNEGYMKVHEIKLEALRESSKIKNHNILKLHHAQIPSQRMPEKIVAGNALKTFLDNETGTLVTQTPLMYTHKSPFRGEQGNVIPLASNEIYLGGKVVAPALRINQFPLSDLYVETLKKGHKAQKALWNLPSSPEALLTLEEAHLLEELGDITLKAGATSQVLTFHKPLLCKGLEILNFEKFTLENTLRLTCGNFKAEVQELVLGSPEKKGEIQLDLGEATIKSPKTFQGEWGKITSPKGIEILTSGLQYGEETFHTPGILHVLLSQEKIFDVPLTLEGTLKVSIPQNETIHFLKFLAPLETGKEVLFDIPGHSLQLGCSSLPVTTFTLGGGLLVKGAQKVDLAHVDLYAASFQGKMQQLKVGSDNHHMSGLYLRERGIQVEAQGGVDLRFAKIESRGKGLITSKEGNVLIGAEGQKLETKVHNDTCRPLLYPTYQKKHLNGSYIKVHDHLNVVAPKGNILLEYGQVQAGKGLTFRAYDLIKNLSGKIEVIGGIKLYGKTYYQTRPPLKAFSAGSSSYNYTNHIFYLEDADGALLYTFGDLVCHTPFFTNEFGEVLVSGKFFHQDKEQTALNQLPSSIKVVSRPIYWDETEAGWRRYSVYGRMPSTPATLKVGKEVLINNGAVQITGSLDAPKIVIKTQVGGFGNSNPYHANAGSQSVTVDVNAFVDLQRQDPTYQQFCLGELNQPSLSQMVMRGPLPKGPILNPLAELNFDFLIYKIYTQFTGKAYMKQGDTTYSGKALVDQLLRNSESLRTSQAKPQEEVGFNPQMLSYLACSFQKLKEQEAAEQRLHLILEAPDMNPHRGVGSITGEEIDITTTQTQTHTNNVVHANERATFTSEGSFQATSASLTSEKKECRLKAHTILLQRGISREYTPQGYQDHLGALSVFGSTKNKTYLESIQDSAWIGTHILGGFGIEADIGRNLFMQTQKVRSDQTTRTKKQTTHTVRQWNCHTFLEAGIKPSDQISDGKDNDSSKADITIRVGAHFSQEGGKGKASGDINIQTGENYTSEVAYDFTQTTTTTTKRKGGVNGLCGGKKTVEHTTMGRQVEGAHMEAGGNINVTTGTTLTLQSVTYCCKGLINLEALNGPINLLTAMGCHYEQLKKNSKSTLWQSKSFTYDLNESAKICHFQAGTEEGIHFKTPHGIVVELVMEKHSRVDGDVKKGRPQEWSQVKTFSGPGTEWLKLLDNRDDVVRVYVQERHDSGRMAQQGMTAAAKIIATLVITLCTMGAGGGLAVGAQAAGQTLASQMMSTAVGALVSATESHFLIGAIDQRGHMDRVAKSYVSKENLKGLGVTALTAALTAGIGHQLGIKTTGMNGWIEQIQGNAVKSAASFAANTAIYGDPKKAAKAALIQGGVDTLAGSLANQIGESRNLELKNGDTLSQYLTHKIQHAVLGALTRAGASALNGGKGKDISKAAAGGAIGGAVSEVIAELMRDEMNERIDQRCREEGEKPNRAQIKSEELQRVKTFAQLGAATAATIAHVDVEAATAAAANAVENSFNMTFSANFESYLKGKMPSFMDTQDQDLAEERMIGMYEDISQVLQEQEATPEQINQILSNRELQNVIKKACGVEAVGDNNTGFTYTKEGKIEITIRQGKRDPLDKCLGILSDGATYLSDFAEKYPNLTSFSITALQLALAGPTKFVREQAIAATGFYDKVEDITSQAKDWCSQQLQDKLGVNETYANVYAEAGAFGVSFGVGIAAGGSKDKILDGAKNVREKVRNYTKSSNTSVGQTHQATAVLKGANHNRQGVKVREAANSNQDSNIVWMKKTGTDGGTTFGSSTGNITTTPATSTRRQGIKNDNIGRRINCTKAESPVWKSFKNYKGETKTNGLQGKKREFYQWDHTHNDIEIYDGRMRHKGSMDPQTGKVYKKEVTGRKGEK